VLQPDRRLPTQSAECCMREMRLCASLGMGGRCALPSFTKRHGSAQSDASRICGNRGGPKVGWEGDHLRRGGGILNQKRGRGQGNRATRSKGAFVRQNCGGAVIIKERDDFVRCVLGQAVVDCGCIGRVQGALIEGRTRRRRSKLNLGQPRFQVHPQPGRRQPRPDGPARPDPPGRGHRHNDNG
jgi:hypothetical protein